MRRCKGCGAELQNVDSKKIGYSPKAEALVCQRCFRLTHYNEATIDMKQGIAADEVLKKVNQLEALILWVVDLFDFEAGILRSLNRHLPNKEIVVVATKRDLFPKTSGNEKLGQFILKRFKQEGINVKGVVLCSDLVHHAQSEENYSVDEVLEAIDRFRNGKDVVLLGMANAGKSTLLNAMMHSQEVTTSMHPGTTLDLNPIDFGDFILYDTPGLVNEGSALTYIQNEDLKKVLPFKTIKPTVYQLQKDQTLCLGGLARIDLIGCENVSAVVYVSNELPLHRCKSERADDLWQNHYGELLTPCVDELNHFKKETYQGNIDGKDIVIGGVGFVCIRGHVSQVHVHTFDPLMVTFREAMI